MPRAGYVLWAGVLVAVLGCQSAAPSAPPTARATASAAPVVSAPTTAAPAASAPAPTAAPAASAPAAAAASGMPAPLSPPVTVKVGLLSSISDSGVFIGLERGYYRDLGLELQVESIPDPSAQSTLISTNQLDVAGPGVNLNPFQAAARGIGLKMVADKGQLRPGFGYVSLIVRQDLLDSGQVRSLADLRGRTIAKLAPCDAGDPPLQRGFDKAGLTREDLELVHMPFPDMNAALANRAVDAAWQLEPLSTLAIERGIAGRFAGGDELYPNQQISTLFYSPEFAARTDAAQRFMIAYVRSLRDYNDAFGKGIGRAEVAQILAKHTTVKDLALYDRLVPAGLDPDGAMNVQGMRDDIALWIRLGCTSPGDVADASRVVDESFASYAVGVLGPYQR
jgi:ABC-type nitrate/sulfonate/bicarbonate transport system substrate-binding protein